MRGFFIWIFGTVGAFLVTVGAFLLLANLGSNASERSLEPNPTPSDAGSPLTLNIRSEELSSLESLEGQEFTLGVENSSSAPFTEVNLTLRVASEDTTLTDTRYYRAEVEELEADDARLVDFTLDLSPLADSRSGEIDQSDQEQSRIVLEVQATTPEGISTVKTAVLPFSSDSDRDDNST